MGLDIGGYEQKPDWPKLGPSLLIASCLILAVRTAKWRARHSGETSSDADLDGEVEHSIHIARRVLSQLLAHHAAIFPQRKEPWFIPTDEDVPK